MSMANNNKHSRPSLKLVLTAISCFIAPTSFGVLLADDTKAPVKEPSNLAPGMKVYIDPETGEFLKSPPPGAEISPVERTVAPPQLEQVESSEPGGGIGVNVKGRFQTPLKVTIDPQGKPVINHSDKR